MFSFPGESLVLKLWLEILHQSKTNESSRVLVFVMIVRAPATPLCEKIRDCVLRYDGLVYRFWGVVDLGRTTQFLEPHTARGGFESIERPSARAILNSNYYVASPRTCSRPIGRLSVPRCSCWCHADIESMFTLQHLFDSAHDLHGHGFHRLRNGWSDEYQ